MTTCRDLGIVLVLGREPASQLQQPRAPYKRGLQNVVALIWHSLASLTGLQACEGRMFGDD